MNRWVWGAVAVLCVAPLVLAQAPMDSLSSQKAAFSFDIIPFRLNDTTGRVDIYIQIPYSSLVFVRAFDKYTAKYSVIVQFRSRADSIVSEKSYPETIEEKSFENTGAKSKKFVFVQRVFALPIGDYTASLTLSDENARTISPLYQKVHIPDYAHIPVGLSGILLASKIEDAEGAHGKKSITPYILHNSGNLHGGGAWIFFELYDKKAGDSVDAVYKVEKPNGDLAIAGKRTMYVASEPVMQCYTALPVDSLSQMRYTVTLGLFPHTADPNAPVDFNNALASASHVLTIDWGVGMPRMLEDIGKAIEELRWVATASELDSLTSMTNPQEQRKMFHRFWERRNPFPGAERNEAMEEYYARVQYADEHFKSFSEGWVSDQGMIYIIFGMPTNIDVHQNDYMTYGAYSGPYTIWTYDRYGKQFVFIDQDGFGDYRLAGLPPFERYVYGR